MHTKAERHQLPHCPTVIEMTSERTFAIIWMAKKNGLLILLFMMMLSPSESASLVLESCFLLL